VNKGAKAERDYLAEYLCNEFPYICPDRWEECPKKDVKECDKEPDKQCWILWARNKIRKQKKEVIS